MPKWRKYRGQKLTWMVQGNRPFDKDLVYVSNKSLWGFVFHYDPKNCWIAITPSLDYQSMYHREKFQHRYKAKRRVEREIETMLMRNSLKS